MAEKRSILVWERWRSATDRFDYFVTGVAAALVAWAAEGIRPERVNEVASALEVTSVLLLAGAVAFGLHRIRCDVAVLSGNHLKLHHSEIRGNLANVLAKGGGTTLIDESGQAYSIEQAHSKIARHDAVISEIQPQQRKFIERSERAYKVRDFLLLAGLMLYVLSKAWNVYF